MTFPAVGYGACFVLETKAAPKEILPISSVSIL